MILPIHSGGAVHARAVTMPCPASDFCSCIRGSVLCTAHVSHLHVLMRLIARVSLWRCYPRTVSFLLLNTVAWRCYPRSPSQPSSSPPWPCMSSRSWHLALGACCLLSCKRLPDRDTSASRFPQRLHCDTDGCLKPNPQDRHLDLAHQPLPYS